MTDRANTLFLRLVGPMQSWGTSSRLQLRRSDAYPSKSGVLGMMLCAAGVSRERSGAELSSLSTLLMGLRVDRPGTPSWDYQTVGAHIGIRKAEGGIKRTSSTGEYEVQLSRRQYLYDASFLVILQGSCDLVAAYADALGSPKWPVFLGRKSCIPAEPVFAGLGAYQSLSEALSAIPWRPRIHAIDREDGRRTRTLDTWIEHAPGFPLPRNAKMVHDVPRIFGYQGYDSRWVIPGQVVVPVGEATQIRRARPRRDPYGPGWKEDRRQRLEFDNYTCVFCKSPAEEVQHLDYGDVRLETLRSLCKLCHDACTMLEYAHDMGRHRIDPSDSGQRQSILDQIQRLVAHRRLGRRRELLESTRAPRLIYFDDIPTNGAAREE